MYPNIIRVIVALSSDIMKHQKMKQKKTRYFILIHIYQLMNFYVRCIRIRQALYYEIIRM